MRSPSEYIGSLHQWERCQGTAKGVVEQYWLLGWVCSLCSLKTDNSLSSSTWRQLDQVFRKILDEKPGTVKAVIQADDYAALIKEANASIEQLLQLFWVPRFLQSSEIYWYQNASQVKNHIAGRLALQEITENLVKQGKIIDSGFTQLQDIITAMSSKTDRHILVCWP